MTTTNQPVLVTEDPVREAADTLLTHLSVGGHVSASSPAINRIREALEKPAPASLTENERKAVVASIDFSQAYGAHSDPNYEHLYSAREKLS